jgi:sortase A
MRRALLIIGALLAVAGTAQVAGGASIAAKAVLAQWLLERAWTRSRSGEPRVKPWRWADTWPVARLRAPAVDANLIVLAGISGRTLAFGPGWLKASSWPGRPGTAVIAGHRDTHFQFIRDLKPGDLLVLETAEGRERPYRIASAGIVDSRRARLMVVGGVERLVLVTCYPFDAIQAGGPLRWVVEAYPAAGPEPHLSA